MMPRCSRCRSLTSLTQLAVEEKKSAERFARFTSAIWIDHITSSTVKPSCFNATLRNHLGQKTYFCYRAQLHSETSIYFLCARSKMNHSLYTLADYRCYAGKARSSYWTSNHERNRHPHHMPVSRFHNCRKAGGDGIHLLAQSQPTTQNGMACFKSLMIGFRERRNDRCFLIRPGEVPWRKYRYPVFLIKGCIPGPSCQ